MITLFSIGVPHLIIFIGIPFILLPLLAIGHLFKGPHDRTAKLLYLLIILAIPFFGSVIYFANGRGK